MAKSAKRVGVKSAKKKSAGSARRAKSAGPATRARSTTTTRASSARKSSRRTANAAFMAPVTPSAALAEVVGAKPIPRTEVTKRLWAYIKKNGLQDAKNRRMIKADGTLRSVFGGKSSVNMFEMTKLVNKHLG
jgi:upstream activation factor subunit UAF30